MGTYIRTLNTPDIPEEKLPEFIDRLLVIADQGGMMELHNAASLSRDIILLKPIFPDKDGYIDFSYNYFEEESWENAGFNPKTRRLYSNKVGARTFNGVVRAMYVLQELYSATPCIASIDGRPFDPSEELGWLNCLFHENYAVPGIRNNLVPTAQFVRSTGDERAYWWKKDGDVEFSPEMRRWLGELRREYFEIAAYPGPTPADYEKILMDTLTRAQEEWEVFFFVSAFDEFMAHSGHRDIQAAIVLLTRLFDGYAPGGELFSRPGYTWDAGWSRHNDNFGAYAVKLYFAVLGNPELRKLVFDF